MRRVEKIGATAGYGRDVGMLYFYIAILDARPGRVTTGMNDKG